MSVRRVKAGTTDVSVIIRIVDSTDGTPETGVVFNTSGIDLWYRREGAASVDIVEADLATPALTDAHADGGFLHINDGWYRLDLPDAAVADGVTGVQIGGTVTGMVVFAPYIELVDYDPYDGVRLGLTALPNAAADAAGGLPISDAGGLDLDGRLDAAVSSRASQTSLDTVDDFLDTEIAAILAAVDTEVAAILADTDELQGDWVDGGRLDLIIDAILADTADMQPKIGTPATDLAADIAAVNTAVGALNDFDPATQTVDVGAISGDSTAADRLEALMDGVLVCAVNDASATTTAFAADGFTEATDDHFNGRLITFISGALTGQQTAITDYDAAGHAQGSQAFVVDALTEAPANNDLFIIH